MVLHVHCLHNAWKINRVLVSCNASSETLLVEREGAWDHDCDANSASFSSPLPFSLVLACGAFARETKDFGGMGFMNSFDFFNWLFETKKSWTEVKNAMTLPYSILKHHDCIHEDRKFQNLGLEMLCLQSPSFLVPRPRRFRKAKRAMVTTMILRVP